MEIRENWRVILLAIFLVVSTFAIFAPGVGGDGGGGSGAVVEQASDGPTNLQFGLELSGGTRIRAPVNGLTAENVDVPQGTGPGAVERQVAGNLSGVEAADVSVRLATAANETTTVEVFSKNVTEDEFASALQQSGYDYGTIRQGVTEQTRNTITRILRDKISEAGLSGGRVQQVTTASNEHFIVIEMPNTNRSQVRDLVTERGQVQVVAVFPAQNQSGNGTQYRHEPLLSQGDFSSIGTAQVSQRTGPHVPVVLNQQAAENFSHAMRTFGFTGEGVDACNYRANPDDPGYCLYTVVDGEVVYAASVAENLAQTFRQEKFTQSPNFVMGTANLSEARELQIHLNAGSLPASLNLEQGTSYFLAPSLAEEFKLYSLITGLVAVAAVSAVVFLRYGDPKVAAPMLVTALSEVVILLGVAAAIQLPLDLSHIAGFIAVIGTGVDDLIIIADEVMSEGDVNSSRVFQSRFRKAFWVIGAAAATTIIAMSPLAVLSLGDLQGFALITILGVLIGVLVTRPAYGDILRSLLTDR
ncbi:preprotein translocase subunit SecD [Halorussus sp. MSC15.2]|uniref:preprotein translocase subunit SecD n=1 Tax=Halorussus sp. MSC15.2 TaxID=2283638 RepID=UPI0013D27B2B|nr:preprotein translocase subunit SecD [Halorussus sp. MSC15.2]NEU55611.1 preprotein translocase subunit SecD [Halorussus sp. MSC15.2]